MFIDDNPNEANFVCQLVHTLKIRQKSCTLININAKFLDQVCDSESERRYHIPKIVILPQKI